MQIVWTLLTRGDPLAAVRRFLHDLWPYAEIEGMVVQMEPDGRARLGTTIFPERAVLPEANLVDDPQQLLSSDPFLPVVPINTTRLVGEIAKKGGDKRIGAVLRPCEARALRRLPDIAPFIPQRWLLIGVDCLGSYPVEDYIWRLEKAGTAEQLTRQELRNVRQGGISPDRFRPACQMCMAAEVPELDISIGILGMPVKEAILVGVKDEEMAKRLNLERITDGLASLALVEQHARMLELVSERRGRYQERAIDDLPAGLPEEMEDLLAHLRHCMALSVPCQVCLHVCPVYSWDWQPSGDENPAYWKAAMAWLDSCAGCGMCEQACPDHLPLAAIHNRISRQMEHTQANSLRYM